MDEFVALATDVTTLTLAFIFLYAFFKGLVVPASIVKAVVQDTVAAVLAETRQDYEQMLAELTAEITARTIKAIDEMLKDHRNEMQREFEEVREFVTREVDRAELRNLRRQTSPLDTGVLERTIKDD